jgi:hypothetical protein
MERMDRAGDALEAELRHSLAKGLVDMMRDEVGWTILSGATAAGEIDASERTETVKTAHLYGIKDPLCKHTLRLYRDLCFGREFEFSPKKTYGGKGEASRQFWNSLANDMHLGHEGQRRGSDHLLADGERFFVLWGDGPKARVRTLPVLSVERIVMHPEDEDTPLWYCRTYDAAASSRAGSSSVVKVAYPDARALELNKDALEASRPAQYQEPAALGWSDNPRVYHVRINTFGQRGNSIFAGALGSAKGWRQFMEARLAVALGRARRIWKRKLTGKRAGPAHVSAATAEERSTLTVDDDEDNPPPAYGATRVENEFDTMTPLGQDTGASGAVQDATLFIARFGQSVGFPPYFFGVETLSRMATADAMDKTVLAMLTAYQTLWTGIYSTLIGLAIDPMADPDEIADWIVPEIDARDALELVKAGKDLIVPVPALADDQGYMQWLLSGLGLPDPETTAESLMGLRAERRARAEEIGAAPTPPSKRGEGPMADALVEFIDTLGAAQRFLDERDDGGNGR